MTGAHRRSLALLLPEEDTVILLTEKNNIIHHLLFSLSLSSSISLPVFRLCYAMLLCFCPCPSEDFEATPSPLDPSPQVRIFSDNTKAEVDPIRSSMGWNNPKGCNLSTFVPLYVLIFWLGTHYFFNFHLLLHETLTPPFTRICPVMEP